MDLTELFRRFGPRLSRWPKSTGVVVGLAAAWGLAHTECALKWRGGGCFLILPGQNHLFGQLVWGLSAAVVTWTALEVVRRRLRAERQG